MRTAIFAVTVAGCLLAARLPWAAVRSFARLPRAAPPVAASRAVRRRARGVPEPDVLLLLDLLDAAILAGASVPRALGAVGAAIAGADVGVGSGRDVADTVGAAPALTRAASALLMGADWHAAWRGSPARLAPLVDGLAPSWVTGAAPGPALRATADRVRRERRNASREAAGRLGVLLVLPLGLCFLPAFVLIGLAPVILSLTAGLLA